MIMTIVYCLNTKVTQFQNKQEKIQGKEHIAKCISFIIRYLQKKPFFTVAFLLEAAIFC